MEPYIVWSREANDEVVSIKNMENIHICFAIRYAWKWKARGTYVRACTCVCVCVYVYMYVCVCVHVCMYVCMYVCVHVHVYIISLPQCLKDRYKYKWVHMYIKGWEKEEVATLHRRKEEEEEEENWGAKKSLKVDPWGLHDGGCSYLTPPSIHTFFLHSCPRRRPSNHQ